MPSKSQFSLSDSGPQESLGHSHVEAYKFSMDIDTDKIDDAVLALLYLTRCAEAYGTASWKGHDWDALSRLHEKGLIGNPVSKNKSVPLTEEGLAKSEELFWKLFGRSV